ncbi:hypothetical protein LBMAG42_50820 [Deltaproteobacteria bacterium]|nr:hypothetical protein LBMAG42_50820 [Deltaproteobacteria bacterium]
MGALLLMLAGCDPYAGTWILLLEVTKAPQEEEVGEDVSGAIELYPLADGRYSSDGLGVVLTGTIEANELDLAYTLRNTTTSDTCDENTTLLDYQMSGTVSPDAGLDGTLTVTQEWKRQGCGGDFSDKTSYVYSVTGVQVEANDDAHISSSDSFGFSP